ncbi:MAG: MarR family winged helix-turn-helix transcriptional regulator [Saprospiraceae bacterium]
MMDAEITKSLLPWISKTSKLLGIYVADFFKSRGMDLTREQLIFLKFLMEKDGRMQNELAVITERDKASLTRLVSTLERKGLVERRTDEQDRRINRIYLTETGRQTMEEAVPVIREIIENVQKDISEEEIKSAIETIKKVQENLGMEFEE